MERATPAALSDTVALKVMVAVSTETEELAGLRLTHGRVVYTHNVRR